MAQKLESKYKVESKVMNIFLTEVSEVLDTSQLFALDKTIHICRNEVLLIPYAQ